ncbi:hypothetical protein L195_g043731, partial [Trifolium pratense]
RWIEFDDDGQDTGEDDDGDDDVGGGDFDDR